MPDSLFSIARSLKSARENKGLTQSALGAKVGMPQSHVSKIEKGAVDLQTSNLLEMARALDLELTLVPRSLLPALQALQRGGERQTSRIAEQIVDQRLDRIRKKAERLQAEYPQSKAFPRLLSTMRDVKALRLDASAAERVDILMSRLSQTIDRLNQRRDDERAKQVVLDTLEEQIQELRALRNSLAHGMVQNTEERRPAYALEDSDSNG